MVGLKCFWMQINILPYFDNFSYPRNCLVDQVCKYGKVVDPGTGLGNVVNTLINLSTSKFMSNVSD